MFFDRKGLKAVTKQMVNQGQPKGYLVTLVYLLATTGVTALVGYLLGLLLAEPLEGLLSIYYENFDAMYYGTVSESTLNAMLQQLASALTGTGVLIALLISLILGFYTMVVQFGYADFTLRRVRGQESGYRDLFDWFYMAGKIIWLNVLQLIFVYLWSLLFVIPGILAMYRYRLAVYCLLDDPDISALEAIRRSKALMRGRTGELFVLDLSFFGWGLLVSLGLSAVQGVCGYLPDVLYMVIVTAAECLLQMHLTTYVNYTNAGFYLFAVRPPVAPPVEERPGGYNSAGFDPHGYDPNRRPENPFEQPQAPNAPPVDEDWTK